MRIWIGSQTEESHEPKQKDYYKIKSSSVCWDRWIDSTKKDREEVVVSLIVWGFRCLYSGENMAVGGGPRWCNG